MSLRALLAQTTRNRGDALVRELGVHQVISGGMLLAGKGQVRRGEEATFCCRVDGFGKCLKRWLSCSAPNRELLGGKGGLTCCLFCVSLSEEALEES